MVVNASSTGGASRSRDVVWHELECGYYDADLALWLELAARAGGAVLDIGAGTGRVARVLARAGYSVTALEREAPLLRALEQQEVAPSLECVLADAREFALPRRDFDLCIVPMHTVQLFGGVEQRASFLRCARAHLRARGTLAVAILPDAEPFDSARTQLAPAPESADIGGLRFISAPTRVAVEEHRIVIERERTVRPLTRGARSGGEQEHEHERIELARLDAAQLHAEARAAGFASESTRAVQATDEHVGSEVVIVRA
jgi:SAM-dependent methyltransferase